MIRYEICVIIFISVKYDDISAKTMWNKQYSFHLALELTLFVFRQFQANLSLKHILKAQIWKYLLGLVACISLIGHCSSFPDASHLDSSIVCSLVILVNMMPKLSGRLSLYRTSLCACRLGLGVSGLWQMAGWSPSPVGNNHVLC